MNKNKALIVLLVLIVPFAWLVVLLAKLTGQNPKQIWKEIWTMSKKIEEIKIISKLEKYFRYAFTFLFITLAGLLTFIDILFIDPIRAWGIKSYPTIEEQEKAKREKYALEYFQLTGNRISQNDITETLEDDINKIKTNKKEIDLLVLRIKG